jgi:hypothetical protein
MRNVVEFQYSCGILKNDFPREVIFYGRRGEGGRS